MKEYVETFGTVISVLPNTTFKVRLDNKFNVLAHISGKLRKNFIKIFEGDKVKVQISYYDIKKARITYKINSKSK
ncbi:MAG: translation initiation factor IF-1 [Candidatus Organicella extenuata]|jgi:translation initiation factor IF-1|uniref:Translation initiation factor IF-1 n=1 Tax=Candidatus Organicella extenuata TaxID=2841811 RepID=A0AA51BKQ4_9BACT|nr:MAG: translation initiation factor IF-1 [Candidatus Organicella extenuata]